jgi:hypothetical protein
MVSKKSPQANLENKKAIPMMMGLVMVLSLLFIAFECRKRFKHLTTSSAMLRT